MNLLSDTRYDAPLAIFLVALALRAALNTVERLQSERGGHVRSMRSRNRRSIALGSRLARGRDLVKFTLLNELRSYPIP